jgi:hypothetical protein
LYEASAPRTYEIDPNEDLRAFQIDEIAWRPDVLRDYAVYLGRRDAVEVHAVDELSLNGHPAALLVDPAIDLAKAGDEDSFVLARDDDAAQKKARAAAQALDSAASSSSR